MSGGDGGGRSGDGGGDMSGRAGSGPPGGNGGDMSGRDGSGGLGGRGGVISGGGSGRPGVGSGSSTPPAASDQAIHSSSKAEPIIAPSCALVAKARQILVNEGGADPSAGLGASSETL